MERATTFPDGGWRVAFLAAVMALSCATASWSLTTVPSETGSAIAHFGMIEHGTRACASCHGANGEGDLDQHGPRLAGQNAEYLERQLRAFRDGRRHSVVMQSVARTLTDDQRAAVAAYYASLPPVTDARGRGPYPLNLGRSLAGQGDWSRKVPPCASCHGVDGLGVGASFPPLAGQRADYIERQLVRFRWNERRDDPQGLMRGIAGRLSAGEIKAIAAYYATLPPRAAAARPVPLRRPPGG